MVIAKHRNIILWLLFIAIIVLVLSILADIPYIISILGLSIWSLLGHLVTLDDDMPGGWGNPEGSKKIWTHSKKELFIKLLIAIGIYALIAIFPGIKKLRCITS